MFKDMSRKRVIVLVVGVLLGLLAVFFVNQRLQQKEQLIQSLVNKGKLTKVVVATGDIPKGRQVEKRMVARVRVPTSQVKPGVIKSFDTVIGKVATVDVLKEQPLYSSMVKIPRGDQSLSDRTPQGKRAFTFSLDKVSAAGGNIEPDDRVDVVGDMVMPMGGGQSQSVVLTLFENIQVLAVSSNNITLALTPREIKMFNYALKMGKIKLALRSPLYDTETSSMDPFTGRNFMRDIYSSMGVSPSALGSKKSEKKAEKKKEKPKEKVDIEVYRGGEQDTYSIEE